MGPHRDSPNCDNANCDKTYSGIKKKTDETAIKFEEKEKALEEQKSENNGALSTTAETGSNYVEALETLNAQPDTISGTILKCYEGVEIHYANKNGNYEVKSTIVYIIENNSGNEHQENVPVQRFLIVGKWRYPISNNTPYYGWPEIRVFMFPYVQTSSTDGFVGIILSDDELSFESYFCESSNDVCSKKQTELFADDSSLENFSQNAAYVITKGADCSKKGLEGGAQIIATTFVYFISKGRNRLTPAKKNLEIPPIIINSIRYLKDLTENIAQSVANTDNNITCGSMNLDSEVGNVKQSQIEFKNVPYEYKDSLTTICIAVQNGLKTVSSGLTNSCQIVAEPVIDAAIETVQYKYGKDAGEVTRNASEVVKNLVTITPSLFDGLKEAVVKGFGNTRIKRTSSTTDMTMEVEEVKG